MTTLHEEYTEKTENGVTVQKASTLIIPDNYERIKIRAEKGRFKLPIDEDMRDAQTWRAWLDFQASGDNKATPLYAMIDDIFRTVKKEMFDSRNIDVGNVGAFIMRKDGVYAYVSIGNRFEQAGVAYKELGITPYAIACGIDEIINSIAHELVHCANDVLKISDASLGGYHNKNFKKMCDRIGLVCVPSKKHGWETPTVKQDEFKDIADKLSDASKDVLAKLRVIGTKGAPKNLTAEQLLALMQGAEAKETKRRNKSNPVHACPSCGAKARAGASVSLICGRCVLDMVV